MVKGDLDATMLVPSAVGTTFHLSELGCKLADPQNDDRNSAVSLGRSHHSSESALCLLAEILQTSRLYERGICKNIIKYLGCLKCREIALISTGIYGKQRFVELYVLISHTRS